jgi:mannose-6-phosphate isomerase-like protein (cupin superfamily)
MHHRIAALAVVVTLAGGDAAVAQTAAAPQVTAEADPGVRLTRLIDRAEVRLSRIEMQPGAVRKVHAHEDVVYHLWVPISGSLEITIADEAPVAAANGQAFFMKRGTSHGFRNVGATPAALFEIFIKQTSAAAAFGAADTARALLAAFDLRTADGATASSLQPRRDESPSNAADPAARVR